MSGMSRDHDDHVTLVCGFLGNCTNNGIFLDKHKQRWGHVLGTPPQRGVCDNVIRSNTWRASHTGYHRRDSVSKPPPDLSTIREGDSIVL